MAGLRALRRVVVGFSGVRRGRQVQRSRRFGKCPNDVAEPRRSKRDKRVVRPHPTLVPAGPGFGSVTYLLGIFGKRRKHHIGTADFQISHRAAGQHVFATGDPYLPCLDDLVDIGGWSLKGAHCVKCYRA